VTAKKAASAPRSRPARAAAGPPQRLTVDQVDASIPVAAPAAAPVPPVPQPAYAPAPQWSPPAGAHPTTPTPSWRGFFARRGVQLLLVGLVSLVAGILIGSSTKGSSANTNAADPAATASKPSTPKTTATHSIAPKAVAPAAPKKAAVPVKPNDKGWVVQALTVQRDFVGEFTGTARITNTNDTSKSASFTFTLFRNGHQIGVLEGVSDDATAGKTVTVDLVSQDKFSPGGYTYDFQSDFSF
jgi:hypothetical protein